MTLVSRYHEPKCSPTVCLVQSRLTQNPTALGLQVEHAFPRWLLGDCNRLPAVGGAARLLGRTVDGERRIERLRLAVMPTLTCGNPNAPCIMLGEKASRMILASA